MSLKAQILEILEQNRGKAVSGSEMSETFGVTRNGIWKAINSLKNDGHNIVTVTRKGYCLQNESDILTEIGIRRAMRTCSSDIKIEVLDETNSTNNDAKRLISEGASGYTLVVADKQNLGKGRMGRSFFSPSGGIYMSLAFDIDSENILNALKLTASAAVAVCLAIEKFCDEKPQIKWVNDVFLDRKKISGILTEGVSDFETGRISSVIIGIGLNCGEMKVPPELCEIIGILNRKGVPRCKIIGEVISNLIDFIEGKQGFIDHYRERSLVIGKSITYIKNGVECHATAVSIDDNGMLDVRHDDGEILTLSSGEISIKM